MSNTLPAPAHLPMARELRQMMPMWSVAAFLPLPVLVAIDPSRSAPVSCLYLGVINAWLVTQCWRAWGLPESAASWRSRILAVTVAVLANVALFVGFGLLAGVQTRFPFALMALLSAIPAIGITPWMLRLLPQNPYAVIVFGGFLVGSCKIAACVVARIVYGPDYISQGYVAADWRTAKLMICLLWLFSTLLSLALLIADYRKCVRARRDHSP